MTNKIEIVQKLGEQALLVPGLIAEALAANDRLKVRLTLLQAAAAHSRAPAGAPRNFASERRAVGLSDPQYDTTVSGARALSADRVLIPGAQDLLHGVAADVVAMLAPLKADDAAASRPFEERAVQLLAALPAAENDTLSTTEIDAMTSARADGSDSIHRLVMDMHKAINMLAAQTAVETIDGAHVHHVTDTDREAIKAFMAGLNRTASLAFGHPGLATTAVRSGARLIIQNDIGTTDAHVLVIHVEGPVVSVTYTDIHHLRARFFIDMFEGHHVEWSPLAEEGETHNGANNAAYYLVTGRYRAADGVALTNFLDFLGSRIVFLIDWNKARKALQTFIGKDAAIDALQWAAMRNYGHRAFLELGGVDLVFDAIRRVAASRIPYGARLDEALGAVDSANFLHQVLRQTSEGLKAGRSIRLIRDEIQADLAQLFDTAQTAVLTVLIRHLGVTRMLAAELTEALTGEAMTSAADKSPLARIAKRMEEKADRLTVEAREICARIQHADRLRSTIDDVENATDMLDEGAFLLSLMSRGGTAAGGRTLAALADIVLGSVSDLVRVVAAAARLPQGRHADAADALQAIDFVIDAEKRADTAERDAISALMTVPCDDARALILSLEVARALETATDHLAHAALALRDLVLEELSA